VDVPVLGVVWGGGRKAEGAVGIGWTRERFGSVEWMEVLVAGRYADAGISS